MFSLGKKPKRCIGINYEAHDAGVAVYDGTGELVFASQAERQKRRKSNHLLGDVDELLARAGIAPLSRDDRLFTVRPHSAGEFMAKLAYKKKADRKDLLLSYSDALASYHLYHVDHHLSHAAAAWMFRESEDMEDALYIVFDGAGTKTDLSGGFYSVGQIGKRGITEFENRKLPAARFASSARLDHLKLPDTNPLGVAGKLMGLAGYCTGAKYIPFEEIDREALDRRFAELGGRMDDALMASYASIYVSYVKDVKEEIRKLLQKYPHRNVAVGGGTFLALELNTFIAESGRNVVFGPPVNDSGIALGSAALGYFLQNKKWPKRLETPFIEWCPKQAATPAITPAEAAEILVGRNRPIGLLIGYGEIGPRALGHRSLLAVPTLENKKLVSETLKRREFYRPVAPIVTDRDFDRLFTGPRGRYMQYRNGCTALARELAPGIVHADGTARAQVLGREDNPWLYDVLVEVGKRTGAECLINTSLNGPGKPIANTVADVEAEMDTSLFELVVMN